MIHMPITFPALAVLAVLAQAAPAPQDECRIDAAQLLAVDPGAALPAPVAGLAAGDLRLAGRRADWHGTLLYFEDRSGSGANASILVREGRVAGTVFAADGSATVLESVRPGLSRVLRRAPDRQPFCGCGDADPAAGRAGGDVAMRASAFMPPCDDGTRIDVLVVYTDTAVAAAASETAVLDTIAWAAAEANLTYANSGIDLQLRVVATHRLAGYVPATTDLSQELGRMASGQVPGVLELRESTHADLVAMVARKIGNTCGVASMVTSGGILQPSGGFSVSGIECISLRAFTHEIGHNLGCGHETGGGLSEYSRARHYVGASGTDRRTVMSSLAGGLPYFSSPLVSYDGVPTGIAGSIDNARTVLENKATVARFRCDADWTCGQDPSANCFRTQTHGTCADATCCQSVCAIDPTCCSATWDASCVDLAFQACSACGSAGSGSCHEAHAAPSCSDPACCRLVCGSDPTCCTESWDAACAGLALNLCPSCGHSPWTCFTQHDAPYCSDAGCCAAVCAVRPACCQVAWDASCVQEATNLCGAAVCGLPNLGECQVVHPGRGCSESWCCEGICNSVEPACCTVSWDQRCVNIANALCYGTCRADINFNARVDGADLALLLNGWGDPNAWIADLDFNGNVNGADLALLLNAWGACP